MPTDRVRYYLNGRPLPEPVLQQLDPQSLDRVEVLKDHVAARYARDSAVMGVILIYARQPRPAARHQAN